MNDRIRKRLKDHIKQFNYEVGPEQEDEILILYELNYDTYDSNLFTLHIENYMQRMEHPRDSKWKEQRRPSVFAKSVSSETFKLPLFPKSKNLTGFLMSRLGSNIPFCLLDEEQKYALVNSMYPLEIDAGVVLIHENDFGAEMYIVETGEFEVIVKGQLENRMYSGAVFGELALLHGIPRTATVRSAKKSRIWSAEQTSFTCIRIRDQMYKKSLAIEAIQENPFFKKWNCTPERVTSVLNTLSCKFIPAKTNYEIKQGEEAVIVLKSARIEDGEEREMNPKDLIHRTFYCHTNLECYIVKLADLLN